MMRIMWEPVAVNSYHLARMKDEDHLAATVVCPACERTVRLVAYGDRHVGCYDDWVGKNPWFVRISLPCCGYKTDEGYDADDTSVHRKVINAGDA